MSGFGIPETEIAKILKVDPKTLRKHFPHELETGHVEANAKVAANLYRRATGDGREAVIAAIFWLKCRAGWREGGRGDNDAGRRLGKKEQAILDAHTIDPDSEWGDLFYAASTRDAGTT